MGCFQTTALLSKVEINEKVKGLLKIGNKKYINIFRRAFLDYTWSIPTGVDKECHLPFQLTKAAAIKPSQCMLRGIQEGESRIFALDS